LGSILAVDIEPSKTDPLRSASREGDNIDPSMEPVAMEPLRSEIKDGESIDPFIEPGAITALAALNA
jgi:hypothetical protein